VGIIGVVLPQVPDPVSGYQPMLPPEQVEQIQRWQERAYQEGQADGGRDQTFAYLGATIVVPPDVMPITPMSRLLGEAVLAEVRAGERLLDMGTGSGVNAILAASRGAQVVAVDINPKALDAAKANAVRNGLGGQIEVRYSDVFDNVEGAFDLIVFDPPFRWFRPRSIFESASTDEGYRAMTRFFRQVRDHLCRGGRMLIFFGTTGDLAYLLHLMAEERFTAATVAHDSLIREGWAVDYFTFRVVTTVDH
jgi:release factor glutamine methyltransferase